MTLPEGYSISTSIPSVDTYVALRTKSGLTPFAREASARGLPNSLFCVQMMHDGEAIGSMYSSLPVQLYLFPLSIYSKSVLLLSIFSTTHASNHPISKPIHGTPQSNIHPSLILYSGSHHRRQRLFLPRYRHLRPPRPPQPWSRKSHHGRTHEMAARQCAQDGVCGVERGWQGE